MRETTDEFAARGMRLWREHIQAGIRRMQERGMVRQSAEYVCYDQPVRTRICETCKGTGYMPDPILWKQVNLERSGRLTGGKTMLVRVACPFGCEEEEG